MYVRLTLLSFLLSPPCGAVKVTHYPGFMTCIYSAYIFNTDMSLITVSLSQLGGVSAVFINNDTISDQRSTIERPRCREIVIGQSGPARSSHTVGWELSVEQFLGIVLQILFIWQYQASSNVPLSLSRGLRASSLTSHTNIKQHLLSSLLAVIHAWS